MDEGLPIAYGVLEQGVPVLTSDGEQVGVVHHVLAAPEKDIFHGIVIATTHRGRRFVQASDVAAIHERGVDLRIDSSASERLPEPSGGAAVYSDSPEQMKGWGHWVRKLSGRNDWHREG